VFGGHAEAAEADEEEVDGPRERSHARRRQALPRGCRGGGLPHVASGSGTGLL